MRVEHGPDAADFESKRESVFYLYHSDDEGFEDFF